MESTPAADVFSTVVPVSKFFIFMRTTAACRAVLEKLSVRFELSVREVPPDPENN